MADHLTEAAKRIAWALKNPPFDDYNAVAAEAEWDLMGETNRKRYISAARVVLPEGSVVVPREPTKAMKAAGAASLVREQQIGSAYRAMIAAATEDAP